MSKRVTRLFQQFRPDTYDLSLDLDRENMRFSGVVNVTGKKTGRPSKRVTFHQKGLKVTAACITVKDKKGEREVPVARINHHKSFNEVRLHTDTLLYPGQYTVRLEFAAPITLGMTGLYPCYFSVDGQERALLATQFESHHAREVFPCIDEPEAKATFDLTLITETGITALGNTPVKEQTKQNGRLITAFHSSPRMSSYLLAFVVGEIHKKSAKTKTGTEVNVWATIAQPAESLDFALDVSTRSIEFFEDYFGVPYPLPKADHIALPDFSSGAMENWGLITYRERVLLAYPGDSSQTVREQIALVVAHETSHQWFGNLVTMRWWNDLWLNESFANMMEYQAVDYMFPDWNIWDTFVAQEGLSALRRDATPGVQAVKTEVNHPDEISTLFDPSIVYAKGGRLLFMLKSYIGEEAFRSGLSNYFTKHAYGNTEGDDLWQALSEASNIDVAAFMNPWLERPGFPVISVNLADEKLQITQKHFSDNPEKTDYARLWPVPLFADNPATPVRLDKQEFSTKFASTNEPMLINRGARGHFIVNYESTKQRAAIVKQIESGTLPNTERLMLLNEASMLARSGLRSYGEVLELLAAYRRESNESVWDMIGLIVGETRRFIDLDPEIEEPLKALIRKLIVEQYQRLGWQEKPGDSVADQKLRATIISFGTYAEDPEIVQKALDSFKAYQKNPSSLSTEIRAIVFGVPIKQGSSEAFEYLLKLHDNTGNSDLKGDIAGALCATRIPKNAKLLLARLKNAKLVKPQDADRWLVYLMRSRYVREEGWDWMVDEWPWIEETYGGDKSYDYMPRYAASGCNTTKWAQKYRSFFEPKLDQMVLKRNILIGIEEIDNRVGWLERDLPSVKKYFKNQ